jgi:hypothetical protein
MLHSIGCLIEQEEQQEEEEEEVVTVLIDEMVGQWWS